MVFPVWALPPSPSASSSSSAALPACAVTGTQVCTHQFSASEGAAALSTSGDVNAAASAFFSYPRIQNNYGTLVRVKGITGNLIDTTDPTLAAAGITHHIINVHIDRVYLDRGGCNLAIWEGVSFALKWPPSPGGLVDSDFLNLNSQGDPRGVSYKQNVRIFTSSSSACTYLYTCPMRRGYASMSGECLQPAVTEASVQSPCSCPSGFGF